MTSVLFHRLSAADPAAKQHALSESELSAMAHRTMAGSAAPDVHELRRPRRRLLYAVPIVAVATAAIISVPSFVGPHVDAQAAGLLTDAADAITTSDLVASPDQWWRITITGEALNISVGNSGQSTTVSPVKSVQYVAVDGGRPSYLVDRQSGAEQVTTSSLAPNETRGSWQAPTPAFLSALPRDSKALRERLYADTVGHGQSRNGEVFVYVSDVLRTGLVPADLRASLYRVLATVPGVTVSARAAQIGDRTGIGFSYDESVSGTLQEIVINPATGDLVGEREVVVDRSSGLPVGTVMWQSSNSRSLVDAVPARIVATAVSQQCSEDAQGVVVCTSP